MGFAPNVKLKGDATYNPPPFIAFEVISKGTAKADRVTKKQAYESASANLRYRRLEKAGAGNSQFARRQIWQAGNFAKRRCLATEELPALKIELTTDHCLPKTKNYA